MLKYKVYVVMRAGSFCALIRQKFHILIISVELLGLKRCPKATAEEDKSNSSNSSIEVDDMK